MPSSMGINAIVFTGQGAQKAGMAKDFTENYPVSAAIFDRASTALELDMREICFTEDDRLNQTEFTQPAILAAEIAILEVLRSEFGFEAAYYAGHSLGEYTALVAAGVIPFEAALKIVRKRGALMQKAVPAGQGAMAALVGDVLVGSDYVTIVEACGAEVANYNSPSQTVISGKKEAVEEACAKLKESFPGINTIFLNVSAPFHCTLMKVIEGEFEECLKSFEAQFKTAGCGVVLSNFTGEFHRPETVLNSLVQQISGSVQWVKNMHALSKAAQNIIEIGPSRVLSKLFAAISVEAKSITDLRSLAKCFPAQGDARAAS
ncbi:MAG: ACP S-malonyltransferase [Proteobacteria bacterium]|nr:MAG: ACP S-malonyltransferase [Pseudomonadota bacterium]